MSFDDLVALSDQQLIDVARGVVNSQQKVLDCIRHGKGNPIRLSVKLLNLRKHEKKIINEACRRLNEVINDRR